METGYGIATTWNAQCNSKNALSTMQCEIAETENGIISPTISNFKPDLFPIYN